MIVLQPENDTTWAALDCVLPEDLHTTIHLTLTPQNADQASGLIERLAQLDTNALSLSATDSHLNETLQMVGDQAAELGLPLTWDLPVPYSTRNPVALETEDDEVPQGAGRAWLYIEPDGDVLPAQGVNQILGNLFRDDWEQIWQN
jgi:MoaA/NifB/PqqE/SkfB family radical SAM enzyme